MALTLIIIYIFIYFMITAIDYPQFEKATGTGMCIVEFWAEWCSPCKSMETVIEGIAENYSDRISFFKVNIDDNRYLARELRIGSIPAIVLMDKGNVMHRWQGITPRESIETELRKINTDN